MLADGGSLPMMIFKRQQQAVKRQLACKDETSGHECNERTELLVFGAVYASCDACMLSSRAQGCAQAEAASDAGGSDSYAASRMRDAQSVGFGDDSDLEERPGTPESQQY